MDMNTFVPSKGDKFYANGYRKKGVVVDYIDDYNWRIEWNGSNEITKAPFTPKDVKWLFIDGKFNKTYLD